LTAAKIQKAVDKNQREMVRNAKKPTWRQGSALTT